MTFIPGIVLQGGQMHWMVASPIASDSGMTWGQNLTGRISTAAEYADGVWNVGLGLAGAFEVRGTAIVPEHGRLLLLGTGLIGIRSFVRRGRRSRSFKSP